VPSGGIRSGKLKMALSSAGGYSRSPPRSECAGHVQRRGAKPDDIAPVVAVSKVFVNLDG